MRWIAHVADKQSAGVACSANMAAFVSTLLCQWKEGKGFVANDHTIFKVCIICSVCLFSLCISISVILKDTYKLKLNVE